MAPQVDPKVMNLGNPVCSRMGFWGGNSINFFAFLVLAPWFLPLHHWGPGLLLLRRKIWQAILCFMINYPGPGYALPSLKGLTFSNMYQNFSIHHQYHLVMSDHFSRAANLKTIQSIDSPDRITIPLYHKRWIIKFYKLSRHIMLDKYVCMEVGTKTRNNRRVVQNK